MFSFSQDHVLLNLGHSVCVTVGRKDRALNMMIEKSRIGEESAMLRFSAETPLGKILVLVLGYIEGR